jgi:hypothetical protein
MEVVARNEYPVGKLIGKIFAFVLLEITAEKAGAVVEDVTTCTGTCVYKK